MAPTRSGPRRTHEAQTPASTNRSACPRCCRLSRRAYNYHPPMPTPPVLVADAEPLIRFALNDRLPADGYKVIEADTAAQAIAKSEDGVDLVLLDYQLPDGAGLTVLKRIKEQHPDTLVILLTAHQSVELAVEAMKQGAYHYANKP